MSNYEKTYIALSLLCTGCLNMFCRILFLWGICKGGNSPLLKPNKISRSPMRITRTKERLSFCYRIFMCR